MFTSRTHSDFEKFFSLDVSLKTTTKLVLLFILSCTYNFNDLSCENTKSVRVSSSSAPCPTADPWRTELVRGRSQELGFGGGGGGSRCFFFQGSWITSRFTWVSALFQTYFSTLGLLVVAACPLYVCLSQRESENLCYSSVHIIRLRLCNQ